MKFVDIASAENIADVFTKALGRVKFTSFAERITQPITAGAVGLRRARSISLSVFSRI